MHANPRLVWSVLAVSSLLALVLTANGQPASRSIHAVSRDAVASGDLDKTKAIGFGVSSSTFSQTSAQGGVLVGFDLGVSTVDGKPDMIAALRPVYLTEAGVTVGTEVGKFLKPAPKVKFGRTRSMRVVKLRAKTGYAVAAVTIHHRLGVRGLFLTYARIKGQGLDGSSVYASEFVGSTEGQKADPLAGNSQPIVGIHGNVEGDRMLSLGLYQPRPAPSPAAPAVVKPAPVARKPAGRVEPAAQAPADLARVPGAAPGNPDLAKERPSEVYRDPHQHFHFDMPAGWVRMRSAEIDRFNELVRSRMGRGSVQYDAGLRPAGARLGEFPYLLIQVQEVDNGQYTYAQIESKIQREVTAPAAREIKGSFGDVFKDIQFNQPVLERLRNRIVLRIRASTVAGNVQSISVTHLGSRAMVSLHCYAHEDKFEQTLPTFVRLNNSFEYDEGFAFQPLAPQQVSLTTWIPLAVFAGVTGLLLVPLLFMLSRTRRTRTVPVQEEPDHPEENLVLDAIALNSAGSAITADPVRPLQAWKLAPSRSTVEATSEVPEYLTAQSLFWSKSNAQYRIYLAGEELWFLEAGQDVARTGLAMGGLVGGLIGAYIAYQASKRRTLLENATREELEDEVDRGNNFRFPVEKILWATLEGATWWERLCNTSFGRLRLSHRTRGVYQFSFTTLKEMRRALELLPTVFGERLSVNAVLDKVSGHYRKNG